MPEFKFYWFRPGLTGTGTDEEKYQRITQWAAEARGVNPGVFDQVTQWLLGGGEWSGRELEENRDFFLQEVLGRFQEQNRLLGEELTRLKPSGVVNPPVFAGLERFDDELRGRTHAPLLQEAVARVFADFSAIRDPETRRLFAGSLTGPTGTDTVDSFGYVNFLKDCDAAIQWALFMPGLVRRQQKGFKLESFEYKKLPALRFIGKERELCQGPQALAELFRTLDGLSRYRSGFDYDILFFHHLARGVDMERRHELWGRFMAADTPVPEGFEKIDFIPRNNGQPGQPYLSQFACAVFSGDDAAMHRREGFDSDAMYDVTRNIILGQDVPIPYPEKYWTAEAFPKGYEKSGTIYLFSAQPE